MKLRTLLASLLFALPASAQEGIWEDSLPIDPRGSSGGASILTTGADGDSTTTSNDSFLELVGGYLTLLRGCTDGQIPKWTEATDKWGCAADADSGGATAINNIGDATAAGAVAVGADAEFGQVWTWNTPATTTGTLNAMQFIIELDASTDANTQRVISIERAATAGTATLEALLRLINNDTDGAVTSALVIDSAAGGVTNAINLNGANITNAMLTSNATISMAEMELLDGGTRTDEALCTYETTGNELICDVDTEAELQTQGAAGANIIVATEIDTTAELEAIQGGINLLLETEIDASAELIALMDDETGTGALVFATSPTLVTPALGTPSAIVLTNATGCGASCITDDSLLYADMNNDATLAGDPAYGASSVWFATTGLIFEGATSNASEGLLIAADVGADRTWTLPDETGTILTSVSTTSALTTVGTITTGVWDGTDVAVTAGGTGLSSGTSGGILGFTGATTLASSVALGAGNIVVGGGAGATPTSVAAGATTEILVGGGAAAAPVWTTATGTGAPARAGSPTFTGTVTTDDLAVDGVLDMGTIETFGAADTTPDVGTGSYFQTDTGAVTITDFDGAGILNGQLITIISRGATVYDCTTSGLECGSADITTASGDLTAWQYDGTQWYLIAYMDVSTDMGTDATGGGGGMTFTLSGDTGSDQTIEDTNTLEVAGGVGIDTAAGATDTITITLDLTEVSSATFGAGSFTTLTFDAGTTDPQFSFGDGTLTINGVAGGIGMGTTQTECVMLNASALNCSATGGCEIQDATGTNFDYTVAAFDSSTDEKGTWTFELPTNFAGTTASWQAVWGSNNAACDAGASADVCWTIDGDSFANDAAYHSATLGGTLDNETDNCLANGDILYSAASTFTHSMSAGERAVVQVMRDVDGGSCPGTTADDDLAADALLHAIRFCYEVNDVFSGE